MNTFYKDLSVGKQGEKLIAEALAARGWKICDVSNNPDYQSKDIDFLLEKRQSNYKIEIKNDGAMAKTGNFFIEIQQGHKKGWYYYCEADYLFYRDSHNRRTYIFSLTDLRHYINSHHCRIGALYDNGRRIEGILVNQFSFFSWLEENKKFYQIMEV